MRDPTDKQIQFATAIAKALRIELPVERTRQSLFLFIRDYKPTYDAIKQADYIDSDTDRDIAEAMGIDLLTGCLGD